jgi:hypothetical protein
MGKQFSNHLFVSIITVIILLILSSITVEARYVANSEDWKDVYSVMLYASLAGDQASFLTSTKHSSILPYSLPKTENITIVSSSTKRFIVGYKNTLSDQGFINIEEVVYDNVNLELAKRLPTITKFIIVDDSYGYNALSAASYAAMSKYYVLFADTRNIRDIDAFLGTRTPTKVILFGQLDREVKTRLAKYNPETINKDGRFENNIEMVKRYMAEKDIKQVIISNGEFLELSLMDGINPVLFIGKKNVPDEIRDYVKEAGFQVAVLIGNELIDSAQSIKDKIGISVFVKFAQGARAPSGSISQVEDLDKFPMPSYSLKISAQSIAYNRATNTLELTIKNEVELGTYVKSTITINDGQTQKRVGDVDAQFIEAANSRTFTYNQTIDGKPLVIDNDQGVTADLYTIFGESKKSLDNVLTITLPLSITKILDNSELEILSLVYDTTNKEFVIEVKNTGDGVVYVDLELIDVIINDQYTTIGTDKVYSLEPGETKTLKIKAILTKEDISNNQEIHAKVYYGARENALIKTKEATFEMKLKSNTLIYFTIVGVVLITIIVLFLILKRRKRKKDGVEPATVYHPQTLHQHHSAQHPAGPVHHGEHHPEHPHQHHQEEQ